jgi:hypothetical protein
VDVKAFFTTTTEVAFSDFGHVPSGQDAWAAIEQSSTAGADSSDPDIIVSGLVPGSSVNVATTGLGNNAQHVDPGEGLRVDVVDHVDYPHFPLTATDVHSQAALSYSDGSDPGTEKHVTAVTTASFSLTQVNPGNANTTASVKVWAFDDTADAQGANFFSTTNLGSDGLGGNQTKLTITSIKVYSDLAKTNLVQTISSPTQQSDGSYIISGLKENYTVEFTVAEGSHMDRFVVENNQPTKGSGSNVSFDLGNFTFSVANTTSGTEHTAVGGDLLFEDDGPSNNSATLSRPVQEDALNNSLSVGNPEITNPPRRRLRRLPRPRSPPW